jgi:hypothetical protein
MRLHDRAFRTAFLLLAVAILLPSNAAIPEESTANQAIADSPKPFQLRLKRFEIPFKVDAIGQRPAEVELFVSRDAGQQWTRYATQPPTEKSFVFDATEDGEYWFATRTVDSAGNSYPQGRLKPLLHVAIDTTDPQIDLHAELTPEASVMIDLQFIDRWPDADSLRVEQITDIHTNWTEVPGFRTTIQATNEDRFQGTVQYNPEGDWHQVSIRVIGKDLAGNQTIVTHQLQRPRLATTPSQLASSPVQRPGNAVQPTYPVASNRNGISANGISAGPVAHGQPAMFGMPAPQAGATAAPSHAAIATDRLLADVPNPMAMGAGMMGAGNVQPELIAPGQVAEQVLGLTSPTETFAPKRAATPAQAMRPLSATEMVRPDASATQSAARPSLSPSGSDSSSLPPVIQPMLDPSMAPTPVRYSGSRKFSLDYEVESAGQAGVEEVELWGTSDRGQTWKRWGADPDRQTPFDIETNNDGAYGFSIVVIAKNGLATARPIAQTPPDIFVVVDSMKPVVRLTGASYGEGDQTGSLLIRFDCQDENLASRPITLSFSESPRGPWTTIAAGLENRGGYVWPADPQLPRQIYLRIDGIDLAGNSGTHLLDTPIDVQGLAPRARIRGFNPITGSQPSSGAIPQTATGPSVKFK